MLKSFAKVARGSNEMAQENHLDGYVYHMTHIDNLPGIFRQGAIVSKDIGARNNLPIHSIAEESVQALRDRIFILDFVQKRYRNLHNYVPFYFSKRPPMLYVQQGKGIQDDIIFLATSRSILNNHNILFTDGNASMQKLSKSSGEKVGITPATRNKPCQRIYKPGGPYGTNQNYSNIYSDAIFLENLNWDVINSVYHIEPFEEDKRIRSAEVLIPDKLSLATIQYIAVRIEKMKQDVNAIAEEHGQVGFTPLIMLDPSLFLP